MSDFLKGNFKVKNEAKEKTEDKKEENSAKSIAEELKKAAINSIGGSMVYVERSELTWDGSDSEKNE